VKSRDAGGGMVIFLFGALTAYLATRMPIGNFRTAGSGLFPLCLGLLLMALSSVYTVGVFFRNGPPAARESGAPQVAASTGQVMRFTGAIVLAVALLDILGYPLTSFLLVLALFRILGMRNWLWGILTALGTSAVSYLLFVHWLKIPFPKGWLGL
jgi:putative tricarboxylic transport membrane protein